MNYSRTVKAGILAFGQGSRVLAMVMIAAFLSRWLSKEDYATYRQALLCVTVSLPILLLGLPNALLYFLPLKPLEGRQNLSVNIFLLSVTSLLFAGFIFLGGASFISYQFNNPSLKEPLLWLAGYPFLILPVNSLQSCLVAVNRVVLSAVFTAISRLLLMLAVLIPVFFVRDAKLAIMATVLAALITYVPAILLMCSSIKGGRFQISRKDINSQLKFAVPIGIGVVIGTFNQQLGSIVVAGMVDPAIFAVYINGAFEVPLIGIITGSASAIMLPDVAKLYVADKYEEAIQLFRSSAVKCGALLIPMTGLLVVLAPELMQLIFGVEFIESSTIFRIYLILLPLRVVVFAVLFQAAGRTKIIMFRACISCVVNLLLCYFFVKIFGAVGAAYAIVVTTLVFTYPFCLYYSAKLYRCTCLEVLPWKELTKWLVIVALTSGLMFVLKNYMIDVVWVYRSVIIGVSYLVILGGSALLFKLISIKGRRILLSR